MTTGMRVQDRSKNKKVQDLEVATEKWKKASKVLFLFEVLKKEPEQIIPIKSLEQHRRPLNLPRPHKISDLIKKMPKLFELYKDQKGVLWCGMTREAEDLAREETRILEQYSDKAAEHVTRLLMMSVDKRLPLDKIAQLRRDFGLPYNFRTTWAHQYPRQFKVVKSEDEAKHLELVSWNPDWAVTELEKKNERVDSIGSTPPRTPGMLSLPFPWKFPSAYPKVYRFGGKLEHFQRRSYLSPYADARGLEAGSLEFDKRAVAVTHELLSFAIDRRLVADNLTYWRRELAMPQKLMRILLKHFGIFYVSQRGKRFSVFLNEAYEGSELIEKCPLVLWREKVQRLIGYRGKKKKIKTFRDSSDAEDDDDPFDVDSGYESSCSENEQATMGGSENTYER